MSGRLASKMLTLAPDCYGLPERALLLYLGTLTSESKRQVYVGEERMTTDLGVSRSQVYRLLRRLSDDGLVVRLRNTQPGRRQQYALVVDRDALTCGRHPSCRPERVAPVRREGSHVRDVIPAGTGRMDDTPNGERRLNGAPDHLKVVDIADLRKATQ